MTFTTKFSNNKTIRKQAAGSFRLISVDLKSKSQKRKVAERVGFEPTVPVRVQRFSRPSDSTALAPLRESSILIASTKKYQAELAK